ncbi:hypothetical protein [Nocardia transvalensis]|uniref:hypothetical protein n=1 Tax=Nocardia transvalensis TaxID=37333 RepID=UPI001893EAE2|nr:hypothetical protein [Nocardia transvalensis]MBF6333503.1 hypothetical protein [Nocardia transvalensis]
MIANGSVTVLSIRRIQHLIRHRHPEVRRIVFAAGPDGLVPVRFLDQHSAGVDAVALVDALTGLVATIGDPISAGLVPDGEGRFALEILPCAHPPHPTDGPGDAA